MQPNVPRTHLCGGGREMISLNRGLYPEVARGHAGRCFTGLSCCITTCVGMPSKPKGQRLTLGFVREECVFV